MSHFNRITASVPLSTFDKNTSSTVPFHNTSKTKQRKAQIVQHLPHALLFFLLWLLTCSVLQGSGVRKEMQRALITLRPFTPPDSHEKLTYCGSQDSPSSSSILPKSYFPFPSTPIHAWGGFTPITSHTGDKPGVSPRGLQEPR